MRQAESSLFEQHARLAKRDHFVLCPHADLHASDIGKTTMGSFKTLAAAVLLSAIAATPALAQDRALYIKNLPAQPVRHRFHFLHPVGTDENLARVWLVPNARHVCELSHSSFFRDVCFLP